MPVQARLSDASGNPKDYMAFRYLVMFNANTRGHIYTYSYYLLQNIFNNCIGYGSVAVPDS